MGRNKDPECPGFVSEHEKAESNGIGILQWSHLVQVVPFQSKATSAGRERPLCACIAPLNLNIFFFWLYGLHQYITGKLFPRVTVVHVFTALQLVCQLRL